MKKICQITHELNRNGMEYHRHLPLSNLLDEFRPDISQVVVVGKDARRLGQCVSLLMATHEDLSICAVGGPDGVERVIKEATGLIGERLIIIDANLVRADVHEVISGLNHLPNNIISIQTGLIEG